MQNKRIYWLDTNYEIEKQSILDLVQDLAPPPIPVPIEPPSPVPLVPRHKPQPLLDDDIQF